MKTKTTTQWKHNNAYSLQVSYEVSGEAQETYFTVSSLLLNNVELSKLQIVTNVLLLISLWLYFWNKLDIGTYIFGDLGVEEIEHF